MLRFVFFALAAASVLPASSFSTASCTLGTTTITSSTYCSLPYVSPGGPYGTIWAYAQLLPNRYGSAVEYPFPFVEADAGISASDLTQQPSWEASGSVGFMETFTTPGPPRDGLTSIFIASSTEEGGRGSVSVGPYRCGYDNATCSLYSEMPLPFELGTPFTVSLLASADAGTGACMYSPGCPQGGADIEIFQLFEADGTTPVPLIPVPVPEPSTFGLLLVSFLACCGASKFSKAAFQNERVRLTECPCKFLPR